MTSEQDPRPRAVIVACTDGPLLVRGEIDLISASGEAIPRTRRTVALCRCGVSTIKPFCDGSHKLVGFRTDPVPPADRKRDEGIVTGEEAPPDAERSGA
jgi:CDGSH-type Zn-finger protein